MSEWLSVPAAARLEPTDHFTGVTATVLDFWRFAMPDLRMNNVRGYLAEFLVSKAVGATGPRVEWDSYDVLSPDGIRIEVKSSAYLQAWEQRSPSRITFTGLRGHTWSPRAGFSAKASYNADVYVFAVQTAKTHAEYDPLDVNQWEFYVLPAVTVAETGASSLGLGTLHRLAGAPLRWVELGPAIRLCGAPAKDQESDLPSQPT